MHRKHLYTISKDIMMSLYIPRVFENISEDRIKKVFDTHLLGKVSHVDFVLQHNGKQPYKSAYIHFDEWYNNDTSRDFQSRISDPKETVHLTYDASWYWIVLENTAQKRNPGDRQLRIDVSGLRTPPAKSADIPRAPIKQPSSISARIVGFKKTLRFEEDDDIEALMDEDDVHLITIDGRYVKYLEQENGQYKNALYDARGDAIQYFCSTGVCTNDIEILKKEIGELKTQLALLTTVAVAVSV